MNTVDVTGIDTLTVDVVPILPRTIAVAWVTRNADIDFPMLTVDFSVEEKELTVEVEKLALLTVDVQWAERTFDIEGLQVEEGGWNMNTADVVEMKHTVDVEITYIVTTEVFISPTQVIQDQGEGQIWYSK